MATLILELFHPLNPVLSYQDSQEAVVSNWTRNAIELDCSLMLQGKIAVQLKARAALEEILELYSQKPELGSADAMEDSRSQIDEITQTLDKLQDELYKYQVNF